MNTVSVDIKDLLVGNSLGDFSVDLFIGKEPDDPPNCVTIYDTGGMEQNPKFAIDESSVQIRCRGISYLYGYERLKSIKAFLEGKKKLSVNDTRYIGFWTQSNIAYIERDENDRFIWTINFRVIREPAASETGNRQLIGD